MPSLVLAAGLSCWPGGSAEATGVDAELVLLVDTSIVVSAADFDALLDGYAQAFESGTIINALQAESPLGIAASLVFFGGPGTEAVGVPWMHITDGTTAGDFASALRSATRPPPSFATSISTGLSFATDQFGSETGNPGNGFESPVQAINMTTETFVFLGDTAAQVSAARDAAFADGVDVINGITVGTLFEAASTAYYEANIVGGELGGVPGGVVNSSGYVDLAAVAATSLADQFINLMPEPGTPLMALFGIWVVVLRRRR